MKTDNEDLWVERAITQDCSFYLPNIIDVPVYVNVKRMKLEREGLPTDHIDWEHYSKVLEARKHLLKTA